MARAVYTIMFICLCLTGERTYCQNDLNKAIRLSITPVTLIDPVSGTIQAGIQKRFNARVAVSFDYGLKFNAIFREGSADRNNYRYHKYKLEFKRFFKSPPSRSTLTDHTYLAAQIFYFPQHYRKDNDWLFKNGKSYRFDHSQINRKAIAVSFLAGVEVIKNRWVFDLYSGVGIKKLIIRHQPTGAVEGFYRPPTDWAPTPVDRYEGNFYRPQLPGGFKIGYIISR